MIVVEDVPKSEPGAGEVLIRVAAAGVAPWDEIIREGKSKVSPRPPLTLGSDLSGTVEATGTGVAQFKRGDDVFGVTNPQFCGAQAEYAVASAQMIARKPARLSYLEAASVPVVAVTAWQMLFEYAKAQPGQSVLILGAAGNVGAYAVQFAGRARLNVIALVGSKDVEFVRGLGAQKIVDYQSETFDNASPPVDAVLDLVGGQTRERSVSVLKPEGILVSVVTDGPLPHHPNVRSVFFYAEVTTERLNTITPLLDRGEVRPQVGTVLPLGDVRAAHAMLAGAPHKRGKIVLQIAG